MQDAEPNQSQAPPLQYGSYRILHPLGAGGMSSVYRAEHVQTGHEVALKVLPLALAKNPITLQRFVREARSAESLQHPNIISIFDRGVDQGRHYLVLEYLKGRDLHDYVQIRGPLSVSEALAIVRQVAEGLKYAAQRGLVHRDIKPSNILRGDAGEVKITDLGLALQVDLEDERVTREGTTVGTVDYMSPEQARDSRAADFRSDIYSLGCTLYYLLTGLPPFPGGDIVDKLTRHARSAPPNMRDLRPDVPEALAAIGLRMMAKQPADRFSSVDELIAALDAVPHGDDSVGPGVALVPIDSDSPRAPFPLLRLPAYPALSPPRPPSSIPEISLANLPAQQDEEHDSAFQWNQDLEPHGEVLPRLWGQGAGPPSSGRQDAGALQPVRSSWSTATWIGLSLAIGVVFLVSIVAIDRLVRSAPPVALTRHELLEPQPEAPAVAPEAPPTESAKDVERPPAPVRADPAVAASPPPPPADVRPASPPPPPVLADWVEPRDPDRRPEQPSSYTAEVLKRYLPPWALAPVPDRVEGPLVRVRRVPGTREPGTVSTLRLALNETKGTIEIADQGPFLINDFRVSGESRVIRARPGHRPIIRLERPTLAAVRELPGVIFLDGKSLVLDSLDIIVNLREVPPTQSCLFYCNGADLTVRNCTITLVNPRKEPFALVQASGTPARGARVRFERTMVRGWFSSGFELGKGNVDVVVRESVLLGSQGAIVRSPVREAGAEHRVSLVGGVVACRGPAFDLMDGNEPGGLRPKPLAIRAFDSVFGRFQGAGIASVIAATSATPSPKDRVDWLGDQNLYCGWKGYFASGKQMNLDIPSLSACRSTWNGSEQTSQEILISLPLKPQLELATPELIAPFLPGRASTLALVPEPPPTLEAQTLWRFPEPVVPIPVVLLQPPVRGPRPVDSRLAGPRAMTNGLVATDTRTPAAPAPRAAENPNDLIFNAEDPAWHGDLGAYLRETLTGQTRRARVRVIGAGSHPMTPVRLPDGLVLELRVEAPSRADAEWLSWTPGPDSRGRAMIELHGGTLILSELHLRAEESTLLDAFVHVEDGDLVLYRCQLVDTARAESATAAMISFVAETTRPRVPGRPGVELFSQPPDRPVCVLGDCTLITEGAAIQARLGKGLVGLTQTAIAAGTDAILLSPADVAPSRFDCDLVMEQCTVSSQANLLRLGPWPGPGTGPIRPWLVSTKHCAFLGSYDRRVSDTVLLRVDENAMAGGTLFWQGERDALDVDAFTAVDAEALSNRPRDVFFQWVNLWGGNHMVDPTGPRPSSLQSSVRLVERLKPGRIEPFDLILDPDYHPGRDRLDAGADLARQGIARRTAGRRR